MYFAVRSPHFLNFQFFHYSGSWENQSHLCLYVYIASSFSLVLTPLFTPPPPFSLFLTITILSHSPLPRFYMTKYSNSLLVLDHEKKISLILKLTARVSLYRFFFPDISGRFTLCAIRWQIDSIFQKFFYIDFSLNFCRIHQRHFNICTVILQLVVSTFNKNLNAIIPCAYGLYGKP